MPAPTVALLAFTPVGSDGDGTPAPPPPAYPGLPPPPPPPRRLAALAKVGTGGGGGGAAATPAALWAARAAGLSPRPPLLFTLDGDDTAAARMWAALFPAGCPGVAVTAVEKAVDGRGSVVGVAARLAAAATPSPPATPILLVDAASIPMPWLDLPRLVAAAGVLGGVPALPVSGVRPPAALVAAGALAAGGGWWEGGEGGTCPHLTTAGGSTLSLPLLYLPADAVEGFAAAADAVGAASLAPALAAWAAAAPAATLTGLPLPAPLPTAATRAGRALAAALLAKAAAGGTPASIIADALDGSRPAAAAFAGALLAAAGVAVPADGPEQPSSRHNPAYTTTNAAYGARLPAPHEVAVPAPAVAARTAARAALPPLHPPAPGKERGMRLAGSRDLLGTI